MAFKKIFDNRRLNRHQKRMLKEMTQYTLAATVRRGVQAGKAVDIESYLLKKYHLEDIGKKRAFLLLNLGFLSSGTITAWVFLQDLFNEVTLVGTILTAFLGYRLFRLVTKYGVRSEEDNIEKEKNRE